MVGSHTSSSGMTTLVSRTGWHYLESPGLASWFLPGRRPRATAMIQPPVIAQAVEAIVEAGGEAFLDEALPALERYYRYLATERDPDRDDLISIIAQFESGLDFSPAYDPKHGASSPLFSVSLHGCRRSSTSSSAGTRSWSSGSTRATSRTCL